MSASPPSSWSASTSSADAAEEWQLVWLHERCNKPDLTPLREAISQAAKLLGGELLCLKKALGFERWLAKPPSPCPGVVLVSDWREAKPSMEIVAERSASEQPVLSIVYVESDRQLKFASRWASTLPRLGVHHPVKIIFYNDNIVDFISDILRLMRGIVGNGSPAPSSATFPDASKTALGQAAPALTLDGVALQAAVMQATAFAAHLGAAAAVANAASANNNAAAQWSNALAANLGAAQAYAKLGWQPEVALTPWPRLLGTPTCAAASPIAGMTPNSSPTSGTICNAGVVTTFGIPGCAAVQARPAAQLLSLEAAVADPPTFAATQACTWSRPVSQVLAPIFHMETPAEVQARLAQAAPDHYED